MRKVINKEELESNYFRSYTDCRKWGEMEVMFALHSPGGGVHGEIAMRWIDLRGKFVPRIESFDDSWEVLHCFSDVIEKLAEYDDDNILPGEFMEILDSLGFINTNSYEGDIIPIEVFEGYQKRRKRDINIDKIIT